jgi:MFS superfamily sulfate permease-like transporter
MYVCVGVRVWMGWVVQFASNTTSTLVTTAVVITLVGFIESLIVTKVYADKHGYFASANRELVALGASNLFACFFGAYPAFGSMPRTVVRPHVGRGRWAPAGHLTSPSPSALRAQVSEGAGGRTQLTGFFASLLILITILFLLPYFKFLPQTTLAAIVLFAAYGLVDLQDLVYFYRLRAWADLAITAACFSITVLAGVEVRSVRVSCTPDLTRSPPPPIRRLQIGVFFALLVSVVLVIKDVTKPAFEVLGYEGASDQYLPMTAAPAATPVDGAILVMIKVRPPPAHPHRPTHTALALH